MKISSFAELKKWDLHWPPSEPGPWELSLAGIEQALDGKRSAIGVYWLGYAPHRVHASFEPKYCGKAVVQTLFKRLSQHAMHSHNNMVNDHLNPKKYKQMPKVWFRFVEFATPQLADLVEGVTVAAFREEYNWNRRNEWTQHWALENG